MDKSIPNSKFSFIHKNLVVVLVGLFTIGTMYSCQDERQKISMNGSAKGLDGYVVSLRLDEKTIASENVINEQFTITTMLPREDFYTLKLSANGNPKGNQSFIIYMSEGQYSVELDSATIKSYPVIKSKSTVQNDLTNYYTLKDKNIAASQKEYALAKQAFDGDLIRLDPVAFNKLMTSYIKAESKFSKSLEHSKKAFIAKNRESTVSAYLLATSFPDMEYEPAPYLKLFNALSDDVKESKYGITLKGLFEKYSKAAVNTPLPDISGVTANGKKFDKEALKGKLTLVMFWLTTNTDSRNDIKQLLELYKELNPQGLEIVGVAFDRSKERWENYLSDNHLPWIQIYDSEGIKSNNVKQFGNTNLPYYFLVGPDLNIIERNPPVESIPIFHKDYLALQKQ